MKELKDRFGNDILALIKERFLGKQVTDSLSPAGNWLEATLLEIEEGRASLQLKVRKEMCNPYGMLHGGMMMVLIDEAIGWAVLSQNANEHYTSVNISNDFLYMAAENSIITAEAKVLRFGKKICNVQVYVYNEERKIIASTTSNLASTSRPLSFKNEAN